MPQTRSFSYSNLRLKNSEILTCAFSSPMICLCVCCCSLSPAGRHVRAAPYLADSLHHRRADRYPARQNGLFAHALGRCSGAGGYLCTRKRRQQRGLGHKLRSVAPRWRIRRRHQVPLQCWLLARQPISFSTRHPKLARGHPAATLGRRSRTAHLLGQIRH